MHLAASDGLVSPHLLHVRKFVGVSGFAKPAAAQSKLCIGASFFAPGRAVSQIVHFSVALAALLKPQCVHAHVSPAGFAGGGTPAADKSSTLR